jgi:hypothetical protein
MSATEPHLLSARYIFTLSHEKVRSVNRFSLSLPSSSSLMTWVVRGALRKSPPPSEAPSRNYSRE